MVSLKMLKIKWTERVKNETVLTRVKEKLKSWHSIKVRRNKMIGHVIVIRHDSSTKSIVDGNVEGYIRRRRPRMEYMKQIMIDRRKDTYKGLKKIKLQYRSMKNCSKPTKRLKTRRRRIKKYR